MGKICGKCKQEKSESEFYIDESLKSGFKTNCKACYSSGSYGKGAGRPKTRWTKENVSALKSAYEKYADEGLKGIDLARSIADEIGVTTLSVKQAVGVHLGLTLCNKKSKQTPVAYEPVKPEPDTEVRMIDGLQETDFGIERNIFAIAARRVTGGRYDRSTGNCFIGNCPVSGLALVREARMEFPA